MSISQEIESRIDIVELVREYVPLKKAGMNWKGLSPFKSERTPSFVVSPAKQIAYCFATNQGGGPIKILMLLERIEYHEALQILAKKAGVELKTDYYSEKRDSSGSLYEIYEATNHFYHQALMKPEHKQILAYLTDRGLSIETIKNWEIGYSDDPRGLFQSLSGKGFETQVLLDSGIFVNQNKDKFFQRVIFPIKNYRGNVVAFSGRTLSTEKKVSKYVNSPETPIFHKSDILFGLDRAKLAVTQKKHVIIVEGQMDVISLHQAGFTNVVGISGTALTEAHIRMLKRLTNQIYLCLDNDAAGKKAIFASIENLINQDMDIRVISLGKHKDPDEILNSGEDFQKYVDESISHIAFMIEEGSTQFDTKTTQGKKGLLMEVLKYLKRIDSSVEVDAYIREISTKLDISLQVVYSEYNSTQKYQGSPSDQGSKEDQKNKSFTPFDYLTIFFLQTHDLDFFRSHFAFEKQDIQDIPEASGILKILSGESIPEDDQRVYELYFEERYASLPEDAIKDKLKSHIDMVNKIIFRELQKKLSGSAGSKESIQKLQQLNERAKQMGIV